MRTHTVLKSLTTAAPGAHLQLLDTLCGCPALPLQHASMGYQGQLLCLCVFLHLAHLCVKLLPC
jgi:hypothetical protein